MAKARGAESARILSADRVGGLIWIGFGVAVIYGSWTMDRLETLGIHPATAPGLLPGLLGLAIVIIAGILVVRPQGAATTEPGLVAEPAPSFHLRRVALSWTLCMTYAALLLGRGPPYWLLTAGFVFLHLLLIDEEESVPARPSRSRVIVAALLAPAVAAAVTFIFQQIFLVRLP